VVEYQLVEEKQIDLVRRQVNDLRSELHSKEKIRQKELEKSSSDALQELVTFRLELTKLASPNEGSNQEKLIDATAQTTAEFTKHIRNQMDEIRTAMGSAGSNGLGKKLDNLQAELSKFQSRMDANFATLKSHAANDAMMLEKIFTSKETNIRDELAERKKLVEQEFEEMAERLNRMEETL